MTNIVIGILIGCAISIIADLYAIKQIRKKHWKLELRTEDGDYIRDFIA
jgi:hypothetical protein